MKLTSFLLSVILAVYLYGCMVTDHYLYYIEKGDKMVERMDTSSAIILMIIHKTSQNPFRRPFRLTMIPRSVNDTVRRLMVRSDFP